MDGLDDLLAALRDVDGGVLVPVRAQPRARREGLSGVHAGALRVATTSPPEDGRATERIGLLLARALDVPVSAVRCTAGPARRDKLYRVAGLTAAQAATRLREALA